MIVLGLDPSLTNYGWAVHDTRAQGSARCIRRGRFQTPASMLFVDRYREMRENVYNLTQTVQPNRVGIEFPVFNDLWSEGMYGLFLFSCEGLRLGGADVVFWSPMQVKAHARDSIKRPPKWKMQKADMVEAAQTDTDTTVSWNHNEADAYLVARLAGRFWDLYEGNLTEANLTDTERKYFTEIKSRPGKPDVYRGLMYREDERFFLWSRGNADGKSS